MVLAKFRQRYPQGSLVSELIDIDRGTYIVGVSAIVNNIVLSTGLAGASTVETAEDLARERAIAALMLDNFAPSDRDKLDYRTMPQDDATASLPEETRPKVAASTEPKLAAEDRTRAEDSIEFVENTTPQTTQSARSEPQVENSPERFTLKSSFESEISEQARSSDATIEKIPAITLSESSVSNSADLFAGTSDFKTDNAFEEDSTSSETVATSPADPETVATNTLEEVNFNEIKHQTDLEIKRLGWTKEDGREFLKSRYGKRSRLQLTDNQLLEFLQYLASQPSPS